MASQDDLDFLFRIDPICESFEESWKSGNAPAILDFVKDFQGDERRKLAKHLIEIDVDYRKRAGLPISVDSYVESFPELADQLSLLKNPDELSTLVEHSTQDKVAGKSSRTRVENNFELKTPSSEMSQIGNYHLIRKLGEGGMGTVYLAEQKQPVVRKVALKVIRGEIQSKEVLNRFEAERQAMAMMDHPNIARILDAGATTTGQPYFAMELVDGQPLRQFCDSKKLAIDERLKLFRDVCSGVQHAHQKGIIHRDLKPSNILVTEIDGQAVVKVIDFGLAKAIENRQHLTDGSLYTGVGQVLGTLKYMSPEQASLDLTDIDTRTDIYSLGVILYELLTGLVPLDNGTLRDQSIMGILQAIRDEEPVRPSVQFLATGDDQVEQITTARRTDRKHLYRILNGDLDWIVMQAIDKDRERRYETATGLADDVERFLRSEPISARPPTVTYKLQKFVRKNRGFVTAASLIIVAIFLGLIGTTFNMVRANQAADLAERRLDLAEDAQAKEKIQRVKAEEAKEVAEQEARISAEINRFFNDDILGVSDVRRNVDDITVRQALLAAASKVDGRFNDMPVVEGEIRRTIGSSLAGLSRYEEGIEQLRLSQSILSKELGDNDPKTLATVGELGRAYRDWERYQDALPYMKEYLSGVEELYGPATQETMQARHMYAMTLDGFGNKAEAEKEFLDVLEWRRANLGKQNGDTIRSALALGALYLYDQQFEKAEPLVTSAADLAVTHLGKQNYTTLVALDNLAYLYLQSARYSDAETVILEGVEVTRSVFGENHASYVTTIGKLADLYKMTDRIDEAISIRRKQVEINGAIYGEYSIPEFDSRFELESLLRDVDRFDEAEAELTSIRRDVLEFLPAQHSYDFISDLEYGKLEFDQGNYEAALDYYRTAQEKCLQWYGDSDPRTESTTAYLSNTAWMMKDYATARDGWKIILAAKEARGEPITQILPFRRQVAMAELNTGNTEGAKQLILESRPLFEEVPPEARNLLITKNRMLLDLATCHLLLSEFNEAETVAREVLEFDDWEADKRYRHFRAQRYLGKALFKQGRYDEAKAELIAGYEGLVAENGGAADRQKALESLIAVCDATGSKTESDRWQQELEKLLDDKSP